MTIPDIETQQAYYDHRWSAETHVNLLQLDRAIAILDALRRLDLCFPRILDLGCGTGWLTGILGRFGPATGIELSPIAVQKAQALYPDVRFLAADFSTLPDFAETFDVVISQEVIEHVEDQPAYVRLVERCLRPGGYLILSTPNAWNLAHWTREEIEAWGPQPIERWLTTGQLRSLLLPRFRIIHMHTIIHRLGSRGILRIVNSSKLAAALKALRLSRVYERALDRVGFGLHVIVVATLRH